MTAPTPEIGTKLAKLADSIAEQAFKADLDVQLDAFKLLTSYYLGVTKVKAQHVDEEGDSFASFSQRLQSSSKVS